MGGCGGWAAGGGLHPPSGPFGLAMSHGSARYRPKHV